MRVHLVLLGAAATCNFGRELCYQAAYTRSSPVRVSVSLPGRRTTLLPVRHDPTGVKAAPLLPSSSPSSSPSSTPRATAAVWVLSSRPVRAHTMPAARGFDVLVLVGEDADEARRIVRRCGRVNTAVHFVRTPMRAAPFATGLTPKGDAAALAGRVLSLLESVYEE